MMDAFLKVAYETQRRETWTGDLVELLKQLPEEDLSKLASGVPIKEAFLDCPPSGSQSWLEQFKGSPLMEQAIALEQEGIQAEILSMQRREENRARNQQEDSIWDMQDQLRIKRRLLELQLAKQNVGSASPPVPGETAQGAGAPGDVPAEGVQDNAQGLGGKTASALEKEKFAFADKMGRLLARDELAHEKAAAQAGAVMAKEALNLGGIGSALGKLGPMASKALGFAAKNPTLVGAGLGAAGGALAGGPEHRLSGALGGAALGAGAGNAAGGIAKGMQGGQGLLQAAKGYGQGVAGKLQGVLGKTPAPPPA